MQRMVLIARRSRKRTDTMLWICVLFVIALMVYRRLGDSGS